MKVTLSKMNHNPHHTARLIVNKLVYEPKQRSSENGCYSKEHSDEQCCFQVREWLKCTHLAECVGSVQKQYDKLSDAKIQEIGYIYKLIQMHVFQKLGHLLIGFHNKHKLVSILCRFATVNHTLNRIPYMQAYGWLGCHFLYHADEATSYFLLDQLVDRLQLYDPKHVEKQQVRVRQRIQSIIPKALQIFSQYNISVMDIIRNFSTDVFCRCVPMELMGWNIQRYYERGWEHFVLLMCSYIDYKLETNKAQTRHQLYKGMFATGGVPWPIIFANLSLYQE